MPPPRSEPLAREDLRGLKRWVLVAGVWAVAATAIALIALLDDSEGKAERRADDAARRSAAVERDVDRRIDTLEKRIEALPRSEDVTNLEGRLVKAEKSAADAADDAKSARDKLGDLEDRVKTLEEDAASGTDSGGDQKP